MGRTLDAVEHYADTPEVVIEPTETARAVFIENPPGADALKVLIALLDKAGPQIAEDVAHEIRLRELNARKVIDVQGNERGMRHHDQDAIRNVMNKLAVALLNLDEPGKQRLHIGTIVPQATIDYRDEASGDLVITWRFGAVFRKLAAESDLYTKLDAAALLAMRSRYAIALLRHCSTHFEKTKTAQQEFAVDHLRQVLGVPDGRHKNFHDLRRHALEPAIAEINATSRWDTGGDVAQDRPQRHQRDDQLDGEAPSGEDRGPRPSWTGTAPAGSSARPGRPSGSRSIRRCPRPVTIFETASGSRHITTPAAGRTS